MVQLAVLLHCSIRLDLLLNKISQPNAVGCAAALIGRDCGKAADSQRARTIPERRCDARTATRFVGHLLLHGKNGAVLCASISEPSDWNYPRLPENCFD